MSPRQPERVSLAFVLDTTSPRFSRRTFLGTLAFASAAGFVAACGGSGSGSGGGTEAKTLNLFNWTDYIAPETVPGFQRETGIRVTYDTFASNDELVAKMEGGGVGYDIIVPTDGILPRLRRSELLRELDLAQIPNVTNLEDRFRTADYDPGNRYSIPWQWGTTGIGYDPEAVGTEVTDWDGFELAGVRGRSSFLDEARDAFGLALFRLGHDPNTTDPEQLDEARDYLIDLKGRVKAITSDYQEPLKSGELILAQAFSGDAFQVAAEAPKVRYVIPRSGAFQYADVMAIPTDAPHPDNAHAFMNYILEPEVGAALSNYVQYGSPNRAALPFIDRELVDNPLIYPPPEILSKLAFLRDLGETELEYSDRWTEIKTA
ncbi:MAG: PotD/PotF family extracellular solute-binding protein [Actinomycetota bacterium]